MQKARIYQPAKTAMQSGRAKTKSWVLEWQPAAPMKPDALMGWSGMQDTTRQLKLQFASCEDAVKYAKEQLLDYEIQLPHGAKTKPKAYADNFSFNRIRA